MEGVRSELITVVNYALKISPVDFSVPNNSVRTVNEQKSLVIAGASRAMNSRHLTGHAVDLVPYVNGPRWDWPLCFEVARAMQVSAKKFDTLITWGGVWDTPLNDLQDDLEEEVASYIKRQKVRDKKAFTDGPHFQLEWEAFPLI
jgi:peptidoglycan L-alanyl-D-glutamate endopeptidase CwlK